VADIDVVRKRGIPMWVWLLLVVVAVIALFALMSRGRNETSGLQPRTEGARPVPSAMSSLRV
jgi:hypothetical protein